MSGWPIPAVYLRSWLILTTLGSGSSRQREAGILARPAEFSKPRMAVRHGREFCLRSNRRRSICALLLTIHALPMLSSNGALPNRRQEPRLLSREYIVRLTRGPPGRLCRARACPAPVSGELALLLFPAQWAVVSLR